MRALFRHKETGRLKVTRITLVLFLIMLVAFSAVYKMGKTVNRVLVSIEHVFEAEQVKEPEPVMPAEVVKKAIPEQTIEKTRSPVSDQKVKELEPPDSIAKVADKIPAVQEPAGEPVEKLAEKPEKMEKAFTKTDTLKEVDSEVKTEKAAEKAVKATAMTAEEPGEKTKSTPLLPAVKEPVFNETLEKMAQSAPKAPKAAPKKVQLVSEKMKEMIEKANRAEPEEIEHSEHVTLKGKDYFEVYNEWQAAGDTLDKQKKMVALRIVNLENVYELFQMKVVALKDSRPHMDLTDHSRVANPSLSEFSTTCFVVSKPWEKWGEALKTSGFHKNDNIQVRYYTYDFVRNSIYARAMKAFEWSLKQKNLPNDTDPGTADVLGVVYAVKKDSGGSFGVFVPTRVDFVSHGSVAIDPLICFSGQKDIEALNNAGLL